MLASDLVNLVGRWNKQADETEQKELSVRRELEQGAGKNADSLQGEVKALRQAADELWQILEEG